VSVYIYTVFLKTNGSKGAQKKFISGKVPRLGPRPVRGRRRCRFEEGDGEYSVCDVWALI
jgi:hypothetical protein